MHVEMSLLHLDVDDVKFLLVPHAQRVQGRRSLVICMLHGKHRKIFAWKSQLTLTGISLLHLFHPALSGRRCGRRLCNGRHSRFPAARWLEQVFDLKDALSFFERGTELIIAQGSISLMVVKGDIVVFKAIWLVKFRLILGLLYHYFAFCLNLSF